MKVKLLRISKHITQKELCEKEKDNEYKQYEDLKLKLKAQEKLTKLACDEIDKLEGRLKYLDEILAKQYIENAFLKNENEGLKRALEIQTKIAKDNKEER